MFNTTQRYDQAFTTILSICPGRAGQFLVVPVKLLAWGNLVAVLGEKLPGSADNLQNGKCEPGMISHS